MLNAIQQGSKQSSQSAYVFLSFVISSLFSGLLQELLPYLMCLLYGCKLNAALRIGDPLIKLNAERCPNEHRLLERARRRHEHTLKMLLRSAIYLGIVKRIVDLSVDPTHLIYWGKRMIKRWGAPFSTMMNRAVPGLFPIKCLDLLSGLFLHASDFVGKSKRDRRRKMKDLGRVVAKKILRCIDFLHDAHTMVRSLTGDEGMFSSYLIGELERRRIHHLFAIRSRSKLHTLIPTIGRWVRLEDGRLLGIKRNITHNGVRTNLIAVKDNGRTYPYVSSCTKGAKYVWGRFCRRGRHENQIGVAKSIGFEDGRPSTNLFQIKGHALTCIYLLMLLKTLSEKLNLDPNTEPETIKNLLTRQCYVRWDSKGRLIALVIVSRAMLTKVNKSRIEWEEGSIELPWHQQRRGNGTLKIPAKG